MGQKLLPLFHDESLPLRPVDPAPPLSVAGLFAGIGGIELGLHRSGHSTAFLCEIDRFASEVLKERFPEVKLHGDITHLEELPDVDLIAAGFPCQDLSISGKRAGIEGDRSSLAGQIFRLLDQSKLPPKWILLENVPFMLQLQQGKGMNFLIDALEVRGFRWAYRVVDTTAFGIPHRRRRVILLASQTDDPKHVLLGADAGEPRLANIGANPVCGFYWTEGHRGIGWSAECVPPIKVGSGLGIPSSPAVWDPATGSIFKLDIRDVERLQGFPTNWTLPAEHIGRRADRWKLVGNSVSVPLGHWIGSRLRNPTTYDFRNDWPLVAGANWPNSAWGENGDRYSSSTSMWPVAEQLPLLLKFLEYSGPPLSTRAAAGLLRRIETGSTNVPDDFLRNLRALARKEERRLALATCQDIEREIARLNTAVRSSTQFAEQVELNARIKELADSIREAKAKL